MKKIIRPLLCSLLCLALLAGCLPQGTQGQGAPASAAPSSGASSTSSGETPQNPPQDQGALTVLLPAGEKALAELLQQMAEAEGITLTVREANTAEAYATQAVAALAEQDAPDLLMVSGEGEARVIGAWTLEDLTGAGTSEAFGAMADMTPAAVRLLEEDKVYGLPLGAYAEGYLVDMEMLAALLGAANTAALQNDLMNSSWEQWSQMLAALEIYLQRPASMRIQLGDGVYNTPSYRPRIAQPLRGIFAFADGTPAAVMESALDAAVYAPYSSPADFLSTDEEQVRDYLFPCLESLYALMDFETLHMARPEGTVFRGEEYAKRPPLTMEEAQAEFGAGTALLYRADSRIGMALEQEYTRVEDRLALLPVKLPPPVLPEEEDTSASSSDSETETDDSEVTEAEETAAEFTAAAIEARNTVLWYGVDGYLCLNAQSPNKAAAQSLLLRLFTTQEGLDGISDSLHLYAITDAMPTSPLAQQVSRLVQTGQGSLLPAPQAILASAGQTIGAFVADDLMDKAEWGEEEAYDFLVTSLEALGYRVGPEGLGI